MTTQTLLGNCRMRDVARDGHANFEDELGGALFMRGLACAAALSVAVWGLVIALI
jgi:hypothetical protein